MLKLVGTIVVLLFYPLGCRRVAAQAVCSENPFTALRPSTMGGSSVDCSQYNNDEADCWDEADCYFFDASSQLPPQCADVPVYWPKLNQFMTITLKNEGSPVTITGSEASGPAAKYSCVPSSLTKSALCYDGVTVYPDNEYLVLLGVPDNVDVLGIDMKLTLTKSTYLATSVFPLSAMSPNPLGTCIYKSLGTTNILLTVDASQENVVAIRLKRLAGQSNISGDKIQIKLSSVSNPWPTGDGKPLPEPNDHQCPRNWAEAITTPCTSDQRGLCNYSFRYVGCTFGDLKCQQYYTCDCQSFLNYWRCWGGREMPVCPPNSPTERLVGESCDPHAALPKDPNPPPPECPATMKEAAHHSCDGRIPRCNYNFEWHGCFPGELYCESNGACVCQGQWICSKYQHYCKNPEGRPRSSLIGTSCDPAECPPVEPVSGLGCTVSKKCEYNFLYSGCSIPELKCTPVKSCDCVNGVWRCSMRSEPLCEPGSGVPTGRCDPTKPIQLPSN